MLSLMNLSMAAIVNWTTENIENGVCRFQGLLQTTDLPPRYRRMLVSSLLNKLFSVMSFFTSAAKQREIIPLLKLCVKTSKVFCGDSIEVFLLDNDYCNDTMCKIIERLGNDARSELFNAVHEDDEMKITILHYSRKLYY